LEILDSPCKQRGIHTFCIKNPVKNEPILPELSRETPFGQPCPITMRWQNRSRRGFTLIELLLVISIIGILTALIVSAAGSAHIGPKIAVAQTELAQMESAIQDYKDGLGFYPPDNPANPAVNPLWFELLGTTNNGNNYVTLDHSGQISLTDINRDFNRQGFANSATRARATDDAGAPMSFLKNLTSKQVGPIDATNPSINVLLCSVQLPTGSTSAPIAGTALNPWRYVSSHPTHNTGSYDLWVDLALGGKTYRISNWSKQPEVNP
jgi:prepilin-type N-terminal cleavage/methylation domain-containing protein